MSTPQRTTFALAALLLSLPLLAGCYEGVRCGPERCDGIDNDCDDARDEDFVDAEGRFVSAAHCGACGLRCDDVFPKAAATACELVDGAPRCAPKGCAEGLVEHGTGNCVAEVEVGCMPCEADADCTLLSRARCLNDAEGHGRCFPLCADGEPCAPGFTCARLDGSTPVCAPVTGSCSCTPELVGSELACLLRSARGDACIGSQRCEPGGPGPCTASLDEICNHADEDCDGALDEGFVDARGAYSSDEHCGACNAPCLPSGPNVDAACTSAFGAPRCQRSCRTGFVDLDGIAATGCECELTPSSELVIGQDGDCDGVTDPTPELVFVAPSGDDALDGESVETAVRTVQRGIELGAALGRTVLVARGVYRGPIALQPGVQVLAGYRPDFRARDLALYPVLVELAAASEGQPVLTCQGIDVATRIDGLTLVGGDAATPGQGSTTVFLDRCTEQVTLARITVLAGRAAPGNAGADGSERLGELGLGSLADLIGLDGESGADGTTDAVACTPGSAGGGGVRVCPRGDVSGGRGGDATCPDLRTLCVNGSGMPCGNAGCTDFTDPSGVCDLAAAKTVAIAGPPAEPGAGGDLAPPGEQTYASVTNRFVCSFCDDNPTLPREGDDGGDGTPGGDGGGGSACRASEVLDFVVGAVRSRSGGGGGDGRDGGGGGGATAGAGYAVIGNTEAGCVDVRGGAGGGGGSGGCGAPGGGGGGGGGASVGVLVRMVEGASAGPTLEGLRIVTGSGGDGGNGGIGAAGGDGGGGGLGGSGQDFCARNGGRGGDGGDGGDGGGGGGGCGGGSYGFYVVGEPSEGYVEALSASAIEAAGVPGRAGNAGFSPGEPGASGRAGEVASVLVAAL